MDQALKLDCAINWNLVLTNLKSYPPAYDDALLNRPENPGAGPSAL
jgi:hypothetical protein